MHLMHLQRPSGENMLPSRRVNRTTAARLLLGILLFCSHKSWSLGVDPAALSQAVRGLRHLGLWGGRCRWGKEVRRTAGGGTTWTVERLASRMCFLSVGWACKGNRGLYTQVFFSECTDQVSHSTTWELFNKSLEGRLEDLGKNPFWKPEGGRSLFSTISPAPPSTPSTLFPALPRILI